MYRINNLSPAEISRIKITNQQKIKDLTGSELDLLKAFEVIKFESNGFTDDNEKAKEATAIQELLTEYEAEDDKKLFIRTAKESIAKLYSLVEVNSPEAIPQQEGDSEKNEPTEIDEESKKQEAIKRDTDRKEKSKKVMEDLEEISNQIEGCREVIREYNKKKREGKEPVKKTRLAKLKDKLVGIASLIPEKLKEDKSVRNKTEKVLLRTLNDLKKTWKMNVVKKAQEAIKEKFDQLDEKASS